MHFWDFQISVPSIVRCNFQLPWWKLWRRWSRLHLNRSYWSKPDIIRYPLDWDFHISVPSIVRCNLQLPWWELWSRWSRLHSNRSYWSQLDIIRYPLDPFCEGSDLLNEVQHQWCAFWALPPILLNLWRQALWRQSWAWFALVSASDISFITFSVILKYILQFLAVDTANDDGKPLIVHQVFGPSALLLNFLLRRWFIEINFIALC